MGNSDLTFTVKMDRENEQMHFDLDNNQKNDYDEIEILRNEVNSYLDSVEENLR